MLKESYQQMQLAETFLMRDALRTITSDARLRRIFHPRHVLRTDRLRTGYQRMLKIQEKSAKDHVV